MKPRNSRILITAASVLLLSPAAIADNGTWNTTSPASWATDTNWLDGIIADGAGFTANFNNLDITEDTTVTLDGARTIGNLIFGDTDTTTPAGWIVNTGSEGPLTLAGTTPTITVNALGTTENARINATLEGTEGLTKAGTGTLVLGAANTYTGGTILNGGTLNYSNASALSSGTITYTSGTILQAGVATTLANPIEVTGTVIGTVGTAGFATTLSGPITGTGTLAKGGGGVLTLTGGLANTIEGGFRVTTNRLDVLDGLSLTNTGPVTVLSGGSLSYTKNFAAGNNLTNDITISGPGVGTFGALNLWGNATATGAITLADNATISHSFNNATISGSITGTDRNLTLTTTADNQPGMVISGPVTLGTGSITVTGVANSGGFSIRLSNANSYSGGTIITAGTLSFTNAGALGSGAVSFTGNSTLQAGVATTLANAVSVAADVTGSVNTNSLATTLSGAITGDGTLSKTGSGVLTLTGGVNNTIAGGFIVSAGRLNVTDGLSLTNTTGGITVASGAAFNYSKNFANGNNLTNAITLSGPGDGSIGALNLRGGVNVTSTITLAADATLSKDFDNVTISGAITGTDTNLTLSKLPTTSSQPGMTVSGPISLGTGGLTVTGAANTSGAFSIRLSGNNSYTGETRVTSGTLMLSGSARINDTAALRIDSGAVVNLDFTGNDIVGALILDGVAQAEGTYGAIGSGAQNESAFFAGTGIIEVVTPIPSDNFASWATANGIPGEPFDGDFNGDGISNGIAYALGLSPTASSQPAGVLSGNTITFTKGADAIANADVSWVIQGSETLEATSWTDEVTQAAGNVNATISYDLNPVPGTPKKFARLKVMQVP